MEQPYSPGFTSPALWFIYGNTAQVLKQSQSYLRRSDIIIVNTLHFISLMLLLACHLLLPFFSEMPLTDHKIACVSVAKWFAACYKIYHQNSIRSWCILPTSLVCSLHAGFLMVFNKNRTVCINSIKTM